MSTRNRYTPVLILALAAAPLAHAQSPAASQAPAKPSAAAMPSKGNLTQAQALGVLSAVNQAEIGAGRLAGQKVSSGPVHDYAKRMVKEHSDNDSKLQAWSPDKTNPAAQAQQAKGKQTLAKLQAQSGDAFAKAYVDAMVKDHTAALQTLDSQLIPAAKDAEVRSFLKETRAHVADHLAAAKQLQGEGTGATAHKTGH